MSSEHGYVDYLLKDTGCAKEISPMLTVNKNTQEIIQNILKKLLADYAPQKVVLFGSYAYGNPDSDSDIDLLIIKETSERFLDRWVMVQRLLTGTHRSYPVETLVLTPQEVESRLAVGDQFIEEILQKGDVLYAAP
jgi:predicted nucleotidyltransferase